ncbi:MAG: ribonuclease T [Chromatiales bacterium]|nr:ribonuclease T [Chromatiales bacterium]
MSGAIDYHPRIAKRFRGFLPVVVDVETGGFNAATDALLEIAAVTIAMDADGFLHPVESLHAHVQPFEGAVLDPKALEFNGIDPHHPFRLAKPEKEALETIFAPVRKAVKASACNRAILVAHNAFFDQGFVNAAAERCKIKRNPFHPFSSFDTATLGGLAFGQTVLAKAARTAGLDWDPDQAHSALYDTERTAALFCKINNLWLEAQRHIRGLGDLAEADLYRMAGIPEPEPPNP